MPAVLPNAPASVLAWHDLRLPSLRLADSQDLDLAREQTARCFGDHRLRCVDRGAGFHCTLDHVPLGAVSLNRLQWGARVSLDPVDGVLAGFYLVSLPQRSGAEVRQDGRMHRLAPQSAGVFNPTQSFQLAVHAGYEQLLIKLDGALIQQAWSAITGQAAEAPVLFDMAMPADAGVLAGWDALLRVAAHASSLPLGSGARRFAEAAVADAMAALLLTRHAHNQRGEIDNPRAAALAPRVVRLAEALMMENLRTPLTVDRLCVACGVSRRSLFAAFQAHRGTGPMAWWREQRMLAAQAALARPAHAAVRVQDVALDFCFGHFGEFAVAYRRRFGEPPSATLRRALAHAWGRVESRV